MLVVVLGVDAMMFWAFFCAFSISSLISSIRDRLILELIDCGLEVTMVDCLEEEMIAYFSGELNFLLLDKRVLRRFWLSWSTSLYLISSDSFWIFSRDNFIWRSWTWRLKGQRNEAYCIKMAVWVGGFYLESEVLRCHSRLKHSSGTTALGLWVWGSRWSCQPISRWRRPSWLHAS